MVDADPVSHSGDPWGEVIVSSPTEHAGKARRALRWSILAATAIVATAVGYVVVKPLAMQQLEQSCHAAVRDNDVERLEAAAGRWRFWDRSKAAPLIFLAEAANRRQQYDQAVEWLDLLPDGDPMTPAALVERSAMLFEALNRPVEGAVTLERALKLESRITEAWRRLIYFYAYTLQRRRMVECIYAAIDNDCDMPESYVYLLLNDNLSFGNGYDQNTKWFRGAPDEELFLVARALYRIRTRGLDVESEAQTDGPPAADGTPYHRKVIAEYFEQFPHNLELVAYFLERSMTRGDVAEVERLLAQAPAEAASDNRIWRHRGWLHAIHGQLGEADACYQKALSLNCYDHLARHQLAGVERRLKRLDRVKPLEDLSFEGKELRKELYRLPSVDKVPVPLLRRMADYAGRCGDAKAAEKLAFQIRRLENSAPKP